MRMRSTLRTGDGQILALLALSLPVFLALLGFAIDVGHLRYEKRNLQNAADAAALAAAAEIRICGGVADCPAMQAAASYALQENGYTGATVLSNCSGSAGSGVTLMLNNPACEISSDPNSGKLSYAEAVVTENVPMYFAQLVGIRTETVAARAEAGRITGPCIVALGGPPGGPYTDDGALTLVAGVLVHSRCPVVDEATVDDALECTLSVGVTAPVINDSGGAAGLLGTPLSLCGLWTTRAHTHVSPLNPHDPLAYLPAPPGSSNPTCGSGNGGTYSGSQSQVNIVLSGTYTFNPGVYCGGISITAALGANITFNPGTYILTQTSTGGLLGIGANGGLNITVTALSSITGQGVTFYSEGGSSTITVPESLGLSNFDLSAPTSGEYGGVLFFQPASNTSADTFLASVAQGGIMNGAIYAPNASVNYGVTALSSSYNILVARDITFLAAVASEFGDDYSALSSGSPLDGNDVVLVQ